MAYKLLTLALLFSAAGSVLGGKILPRVAFATTDNQNNSEYATNLVILYDESSNDCVGYLISEKTILTAAHCFEKYQAVLALYFPHSNSTPEMITADDMVVTLHPDYKSDIKANDLAIVSVTKPLIYEATINMANINTTEYTNCTVIGFGYEKGNLIPIFRDVEITAYEGQPEKQICIQALTGSDLGGIACNISFTKDFRGSPLVCNDELVAIAVSDSSCDPRGIGVYQGLKEFNGWIVEQIERAATLQPEIITEQSVSTTTQGSAATFGLNPFVLIATLTGIYLYSTNTRQQSLSER